MNVMTDSMIGAAPNGPEQASVGIGGDSRGQDEETKDGREGNGSDGGRVSDKNRATAIKALKALEAARESLSEESKSPGGARPESVDVSAAVDGDHQMKAAKYASDADSGRASSIASSDGWEPVSEITEDDKYAFIESVTTGRRYRRTASIFGGRVKIGLRARTAGESEAIDSFIRRKVDDGTIKVGAEYGDHMRLCLLVFDVERLGEEVFPDLSGNLMAVSTPDGVVNPEWTKMLDVWRSKPEGLVNAVLPEVFKFEAKYAEMVRRGSDENFWSTGGSTGA